MRRSLLPLLAAGALALSLPALAQTANPLNPLQPRAPAPAVPAQATPAPAAPAQATPAPARTPRAATTTAPADTAAKPKRERSEAQKKNDQMMRDCGTEWRANKAALQAKGQTWRTFLAECRKRKTA
jgi:hypothetical protein